MNVSINSVLSSLFVVIIAVLSLSISNAASDIKKEDIIICHGFGEIKYEEQNQSKCELADNYERSQYRGRVMYCRGFYNLPTINGCEVCSSHFIQVFIYDSSDGVKNDLLLWTYDRPGNKSIYKSYENGDIMQYSKGGNYRDRFWVSNNYQILLNARNMEINNHIFNDYVEKYPPTERLSAEDYNVQNIYKKEIERAFDTVLDHEKLRVSSDKADQFHAVFIQCDREDAIRCWSGLSGEGKPKGCKVTAIIDNDKRMNAWKELKEETMKRDIAEENILWNAVKEPGSQCKSNEDMDNIIKSLNITDEDLKRWSEKYGMPK